MSASGGRRRHVPSRSCVACRTVRPKRELVRVVRTPEGGIVIDEGGRLAGRGAYLCRDRACRANALAKGAIVRALGVPLPPEVRAALEADLATAGAEGAGATGQTRPAAPDAGVTGPPVADT